MPFLQKAEDAFAHGIDIRNKYQLFHIQIAKKLLEQLFSVSVLPILNYGNVALKMRLTTDFKICQAKGPDGKWTRKPSTYNPPS